MQLDVSEPSYFHPKKRKGIGKEEGEVVQDVAFDSSQAAVGARCMFFFFLQVTFKRKCIRIFSIATANDGKFGAGDAADRMGEGEVVIQMDKRGQTSSVVSSWPWIIRCPSYSRELENVQRLEGVEVKIALMWQDIAGGGFWLCGLLLATRGLVAMKWMWCGGLFCMGFAGKEFASLMVCNAKMMPEAIKGGGFVVAADTICSKDKAKVRRGFVQREHG